MLILGLECILEMCGVEDISRLCTLSFLVGWEKGGWLAGCWAMLQRASWSCLVSPPHWLAVVSTQIFDSLKWKKQRQDKLYSSRKACTSEKKKTNNYHSNILWYLLTIRHLTAKRQLSALKLLHLWIITKRKPTTHHCIQNDTPVVSKISPVT